VKNLRASLLRSLDKQGQVFLKGKVIDWATLEAAVKSAAQANSQTQAVISADQETKHGDVIKVMDLVKKLGLTRLAIQIERRRLVIL